MGGGKHEETTRSTGGSETTTTTYTYNKTWSDRTINSQNFRRRENHENPPKKYSRIDVNAADATLGAFRLDERVLNLLSPNAIVAVSPQAADKLKTRIANAKVIDGKIYIGADPDKPQIGDFRISYLMVPVGPLSVMGQQAGSGFAQYQAKAGSRLLMAEAGTQSAAAMFKEAEDENRLITWLVRLAGMVAMWLGAVLILRPLVVVADVVPFIGSILGAGAALVALAFTVLVGPVVIAVAWLWYRPLVSVVVLAIGVAAGIGLHRLAARRHLTRAAQPPAGPPPTPAAA
jgi:Transmembrane protein 43